MKKVSKLVALSLLGLASASAVSVIVSSSPAQAWNCTYVPSPDGLDWKCIHR